MAFENTRNSLEEISFNKKGKQCTEQWDIYSQKAFIIQQLFDFTKEDLVKSKKIHENNKGKIDIKSIKWFLPLFNNIYGGGVYTIFRFADYLFKKHNISSNFIIFNKPIGDLKKQRDLINKAFPSLKKSPVIPMDDIKDAKNLFYADVSICTFWSTAYLVLMDNNTKRKFYFIQDYEPLFYPAGSTSGLAESTYNFGFYGIINTLGLKKVLEEKYKGIFEYFNPCVDTSLFYPNELSDKKKVLKVFFYARPSAPKNGFELGVNALKKVKEQLDNKVDIVTAGANWDPKKYGLENAIKNLGILKLKQTADLYRNCDLGLSFMFTPHPSYIPLELMASKCAVVANKNLANQWLLKDRESCFLTEPSTSCLTQTILSALKNYKIRRKLAEKAFKLILQKYSDWTLQIDKIFNYMCYPENVS